MSSRPPASPDQASRKTRAGARGGEKNSGTRLEPHVCRACFGRIASEISCEETGARRYFCACCGLDAVGHKASAVCACGLKLRKARGDGRSSAVLVDAGIRCHENLARTPEFPALFVASYAGAQAET